MSAMRLAVQVTTICCLAGVIRDLWLEEALYTETRRLMGTYCEIQVYDSDASHAKQAISEALDEMRRVEHLLSNYDPDSELGMMNREAARAPVQVSGELYAFLEKCRILHERTQGAFDPTVGPLVRIWGFFTPHPAKPSDQEVAAARSRVGYNKILLNDIQRSVFYSVPGMEVDSGGIGKGYAVDRAVQVLKRRNIDAALVNAGGSTFYALGHPSGREYWRIGVKNPADPRQLFAVTRLRDASVSTSGVAEKSVRIGSRLYSHIFDPRIGDPVEGICQVSVVAPGATMSEAFAKAAFVLPRDPLVQLAAEESNVHVLRVEGSCGGQNAIWQTPGSSTVFVRSDP